MGIQWWDGRGKVDVSVQIKDWNQVSGAGAIACPTLYFREKERYPCVLETPEGREDILVSTESGQLNVEAAPPGT